MPETMLPILKTYSKLAPQNKVCQKYSTVRRIFNSLLGVSSGDETLHLMLNILHQQGP